MKTVVLDGIIKDFQELNSNNELSVQGIATLKEFEAIKEQLSQNKADTGKILDWAKDLNLLRKENLHNIMDKLSEEIGELAFELKQNPINFKNAEMELGDVQFVLTQIAELIGTDLNIARNKAIKKVLNRKVTVIDGKAVKHV